MGFFRCRCGKLHCFGGLSIISVCSWCGVNLYYYVQELEMRRRQIIANWQQELARTAVNLVGTGSSSHSVSVQVHARPWSLSNWGRLRS